MKTKYLIMMSEIIDKMDIKEELQNLKFNTGDENVDREQLGVALISLLLSKLYKCEKEVYTFVAHYRGYYPKTPVITENDTEDVRKSKMDEYQSTVKAALERAENENIIEIFKEISKMPGVSSFLSIA